MKVNRIVVQNIKALESEDVDLKGCSVLVTAGNNQGKSTLLKSLPERLAGKKATIKEGETEGYCEWELTTGDKFTWELREGKEDKLRFITKDNIRASVTKEISNRFFPAQFDIDKFLTLSKNKQKEEIEKLSGIDTDELNKQYKEAYSDRTYVNRSLKEVEATDFDFDRNVLEEEDDLEDELRETISRADVRNLQISNIKKGIAEKEASKTEKESKIEALKKEILVLETDIKKGDDWIEVTPPTDKEAYEKELEEIVKSNKKVADNNVKRDNYKKVKEKRKEAKKADNLVKSLVAKRHDLVAKSKMPQGFSFDEEGELLYNDFPFDKDNLSSSAIYIAALKLATLSLGEVKTIHFDASFLDKNSLGEIQEWAEKQDLQLLIERPDYDGSEEIAYEFIE